MGGKGTKMDKQRDKDVALIRAAYEAGNLHGIQDALQRAWEWGHHAGYWYAVDDVNEEEADNE